MPDAKETICVFCEIVAGKLRPISSTKMNVHVHPGHSSLHAGPLSRFFNALENFQESTQALASLKETAAMGRSRQAAETLICNSFPPLLSA